MNVGQTKLRKKLLSQNTIYVMRMDFQLTQNNRLFNSVWIRMNHNILSNLSSSHTVIGDCWYLIIALSSVYDFNFSFFFFCTSFKINTEEEQNSC